MNPVFLTFILISSLSVSTGWAQDVSAPRIKGPSFPLEPKKQKEQEVRPETYHEGADAPVVKKADDELGISRPALAPSEWLISSELGWFISNLTSKTEFSGGIGNGFSARSVSSSLLSARANLEARSPFLLGFVAGFSGASGTSEVTPSIDTFSLTRFSLHDLRANVGLRLYLLPRSWSSSLALGANLEGALASYTTLTADQTLLDVDSRKLITLVPRVEYRYCPDGTWAIELAGGYGKSLSSGGLGNTKATVYKRIEGELGAIRYFSTGNGLGVGANYSDETATWARTSPAPLSENTVRRDLRLNLFWRRDF